MVKMVIDGKMDGGEFLLTLQLCGRTSNPPVGCDDTLNSASEVSCILPANEDGKLGTEEAIEPLRDLVRSSYKTIRVNGFAVSPIVGC